MKKGIVLLPMTYPFNYNFDFHATVAIFSADGSVAITHGGVETGQGINTKVLALILNFNCHPNFSPKLNYCFICVRWPKLLRLPWGFHLIW